MPVKITSIFTQPIRQLIRQNSFNTKSNRSLIVSFNNMNIISHTKNKSIANDFWKQKYNQCLKLEKCRVVIEDIDYCIDAKENIVFELL